MVNYNHADITIDCCNSIEKIERMSADDQIRIVIVDNASRESDVFTLQQYVSSHPLIELVLLDTNLGYFGGMNQGLARTEKGGPDQYVIVCNNDLIYAQDFIQQFHSYSFEPQDMVICPNIVTVSGRHQNPHLVNRVSKKRIACYSLYYTGYPIAILIDFILSIVRRISPVKDNPLHDRSMPLYIGIGACYVLMPTFFEQNERLDDRVFLWGEEALLAGQIQRSNGRAYYAHRMHITHLENTSVKQIAKYPTYKIAKASFPIYREYL